MGGENKKTKKEQKIMKNQEKTKKSKTLIIILVAVILFVFLLALATGSGDSESPADETTTTKIETTTQAIPQREEAIGKSAKSISDFPEKITLSPMRNDATGNWKLARIATSETIEEYALSYYNDYFEKQASNEVHWIVNFTNHTTTSIKNLSGILFVDTFEYVDGEEHDAHDIGGGMQLTSYMIYTDNGDIERVS